MLDTNYNSIATWRIASNVKAHGESFALQSEINRFKRAGFSSATSEQMAQIHLVKSIDHAIAVELAALRGAY